MRRLDVLAVVLSSALLGACVTADITVTPSGQGIELAARKPDCVVEFHRVRPPERPFDELATLHLQGGGLDAWEAQEALRRRACTLGADAVVVMRDYMNAGRYVVMTGSAVSYPDVRASPAATRARDARGITELMPPPGFSIAVARHTTPLRTTPAPDADAPREVEEGTAIWAARDGGDLCRVRHPDGRRGWVECDALGFGVKPPAGETPRPTILPPPTSI